MAYPAIKTQNNFGDSQDVLAVMQDSNGIRQVLPQTIATNDPYYYLE